MESQPMDTVDMTKEQLKYLTLDEAVGTIEAGEDQFERLEEFTRRLASGEFHRPVSGRIPNACIDGRPGGEMGPNSAGGTFSLTVADDLTTQRFTAGKTLAEADRVVSKVLQGEGRRVGGHCAHADGENCGCGAKDRIADIYEYIIHNFAALRRQAKTLGVELSDEVEDLVTGNAAKRTDFSTGKELSVALRDVAGVEAEPVLRGPHYEVAAAANGRDGESLDRKALAEEFGSIYQAFNIDTWSFEGAAGAISLSEQEASLKVIGLVIYNLATSNVLCGPGMRVVPVAA